MKTILITDDSESIRELLVFTLQNAGYTVISAVDGEDALSHLTGKVIDLFLTDLHMPKLDGIGLIKKIRAQQEYQYAPILFLTTESQTEKKDEAKAAGATGWIVKPFVPEKLLATISKIIR